MNGEVSQRGDDMLVHFVLALIGGGHGLGECAEPEQEQLGDGGIPGKFFAAGAATGFVFLLEAEAGFALGRGRRLPRGGFHRQCRGSCSAVARTLRVC
ncbi:hypothetical protein CVV67_17235 [Arthrobacter stackebrandtii]|nr:hypothetical protein CVV67_17235 [Arthrobacter stackebrandtii]